MKFLKISILFALLLIVNSYSQVYQNPAYVRFIGSGYVDQAPFFSTLEAALNNVKDLATSSNPFVFWISTDTVRIADWDSVFTESGLTMKDSIDLYYVAAGSIKWAGFGFGGEGGGSVAIINQDDTTYYYGWPTWDVDNITLPLWQRELGRSFDLIDEEVWRLIVYTKTPLYIENDTLKIDLTGITAEAGWDPDTTTIVRTTGNQSISGIKTFSGTNRQTGTLDFSGSGNIQLPASNGSVGTARRIWGDNDKIFYSGSGAAGDTNYTAMINNTSKHLDCDTCVTLDNMASEVIAYIDEQDKRPHLFFEKSSYTPNVTAGGTYVKLTPTWTEIEKYNITSVGDSLTINTDKGGDYFIMISFTIQNAALDDFTLQIRKNNVAEHSCRFTGAGASEYITVTTFHYFDGLVAGDDISLYITNTVDADDPVMTNINLWFYRNHK